MFTGVIALMHGLFYQLFLVDKQYMNLTELSAKYRYAYLSDTHDRLLNVHIAKHTVTFMFKYSGTECYSISKSMKTKG